MFKIEKVFRIFTIVLVILFCCFGLSLGFSDNDSEVKFIDNNSLYNVLIVCSQHGNEPLAFQVVKKMIEDNSLPPFFNYCVVLQPSVYRINKNRRTNFEGFDPNRTFLNLFSQSSKIIVSLMVRYDPLLLIDLHQANREDLDFMYSFGNFTKVIYSIYQADSKYNLSNKILYSSDFIELKYLQKDLEDLSSKYFQSFGKEYFKVGKYYLKGGQEPYEVVSVLRNFSASKGIFSVLFELPYKKNISTNLWEEIFNGYIILLHNNKDKMLNYKILSKKVNDDYFKDRFFLISTNYDNKHKLFSYLDHFGIDYYLDKINLNILYFKVKKIELSDVESFKNFIYLNISGDFEKFTGKENYYVVRADIVSSYLLNPIYGESLWNFYALPFTKKFIPVFYGIKN